MARYSRDEETASIMALAPVTPIMTVSGAEDGVAQAKTLTARRPFRSAADYAVAEETGAGDAAGADAGATNG
jgi:hypothetical protein